MFGVYTRLYGFFFYILLADILVTLDLDGFSSYLAVPRVVWFLYINFSAVKTFSPFLDQIRNARNFV